MTLTLPSFDSSIFNFPDASTMTEKITTGKNYKTPKFHCKLFSGFNWLLPRCNRERWKGGMEREREQMIGEREGPIVDSIGNFLTISLSQLSLSVFVEISLCGFVFWEVRVWDIGFCIIYSFELFIFYFLDFFGFFILFYLFYLYFFFHFALIIIKGM